MGNLLEVIRRAYAGIKLRRGQCEVCRGILRDDERRWCSQECHDAYRDANEV
jgi:hypothetical protein